MNAIVNRKILSKDHTEYRDRVIQFLAYYAFESANKLEKAISAVRHPKTHTLRSH